VPFLRVTLFQPAVGKVGEADQEHGETGEEDGVKNF
jgi:hypothetical protein